MLPSLLDRCLLCLGAATAAAICATGWVHATDDPVVATSGGKLRGVLLRNGGVAFKGVPFAQPPVGELRWREPLPMKPWTGVRDASSFGPGCMQVASIFSAADSRFSEDCLYLNIWNTEYPARSRKPVMVWLYGGGNTQGEASQERFDGEKLARRGVVVVTTNYRVGALGFFAHPALTKESSHHASGNQGLLDQVAALTWIRDNIAAFGGDPSNDLLRSIRWLAGR